MAKKRKIKKSKVIEIVIAALYNSWEFDIRKYPDGSVLNLNREEVKKFVKSRL